MIILARSDIWGPKILGPENLRQMAPNQLTLC